MATVTYVYRGAWVTGTTYATNDMVLSGTHTWRAKRTTVATGDAPAENDDWTKYYDGGYKFTRPAGVTVADVLVVGGGGGGGTGVQSLDVGGGGGAGGVRHTTGFTLAAETTVTVGAGGAANTAGSDSTFDSITSAGGGKGAGSFRRWPGP